MKTETIILSLRRTARMIMDQPVGRRITAIAANGAKYRMTKVEWNRIEADRISGRGPLWLEWDLLDLAAATGKPAPAPDETRCPQCGRPTSPCAVGFHGHVEGLCERCVADRLAAL